MVCSVSYILALPIQEAINTVPGLGHGRIGCEMLGVCFLHSLRHSMQVLPLLLQLPFKICLLPAPGTHPLQPRC